MKLYKRHSAFKILYGLEMHISKDAFRIYCRFHNYVDKEKMWTAKWTWHHRFQSNPLGHLGLNVCNEWIYEIVNCKIVRTNFCNLVGKCGAILMVFITMFVKYELQGIIHVQYRQISLVQAIHVGVNIRYWFAIHSLQQLFIGEYAASQINDILLHNWLAMTFILCNHKNQILWSALLQCIICFVLAMQCHGGDFVYTGTQSCSANVWTWSTSPVLMTEW